MLNMSTVNETTIRADTINHLSIGSQTHYHSTNHETLEKAETEQPVTVSDSPEKQNSAIPCNTIYKGRGQPHVLIICNFYSEDELSGYAEDVKSLEVMWTEFGCKVSVEKDLSADKMELAIRRFAHDKRPLTGDESYIAVFVLSHGADGDRIQGANDKNNEPTFLLVSQILDQFTNHNAKLQHVPKLFFFQMCRGEKAEPGVPTTKGAFSKKLPSKLPQVTDTVVTYAAQRGTIAFVEETGSWYIESLVKIFRNNAAKEDLVSMLTMVNKEMAEKVASDPGNTEIDGAKAMSEFTSTLRDKIYLKYQ